MTKEWQEATNEYLKVCYSHRKRLYGDFPPMPKYILIPAKQQERSNPIYGVSSEGYSGKGHVQSKSAKSRGISLEPDE